MAQIILQLGQAGNQVGQQIFETIMTDNMSSHLNLPSALSKTDKRFYESYINESLSRYFIQHDDNKNELTARAVVIDTELKVIQQLLTDKSKKWKYSSKCVHEGRLGSGNNWACGYRNGTLSEDNILNALRWQLEQADRVDVILPILSLAGGTGSGLGTYFVECVRDELPRSFILTSVIVPYTSGEVVVQNYNSLLTLSHLYRSNDGIFVFENDILQHYAKKLVAYSGMDRSTNIRDMNLILSRHLCSFLQPILSSTTTSTFSELNQLLECLVPHAFYKLLTIRCVPQLSEQAIDFSSYKWSGLIRSLRQMYLNNSYLDEGLDWTLKPHQTHTKSISNCFLARSSVDVTNLHDEIDKYFQNEHLYTQNVLVFDNLYYKTFSCEKKSYLNYEKFLTLISNCQTPIYSMDKILTKAWQLYSQKAYLHHYMKYDIDEQEFLSSFINVEQIIQSYKQL
ncbi:unnamed protein product [Didymodactylos carnosus]|uniref:Tubulin delta chain n=1 Tax=Didymodactylos carnosus TaxID=1234261 RepID=A0A814U891_9BILA|nr:unnamed protein product [Didymodactylos carnosus]CAF1171175.1 unnamed protein product [Didymodactylos carnosus]CAF3934842.1 unnamed protein product [Didymodactylos carnosus]CAF3977426.1 unnamed protein product [Didymodactylos carnosus]